MDIMITPGNEADLMRATLAHIKRTQDDARRWRRLAPHLDALLHDLDATCGCISTWQWRQLLESLRD